MAGLRTRATSYPEAHDGNNLIIKYRPTTMICIEAIQNEEAELPRKDLALSQSCKGGTLGPGEGETTCIQLHPSLILQTHTCF
eukprot:1143460-Pelagomonas_calceolata.AAC.3